MTRACDAAMRFAALLVPGLVLGMLICYAGGERTAVSLPASLLIAFLVLFAMRLMKRKVLNSQSGAAFLDGLMQSMEGLYHYRLSGISLDASVARLASEASGDLQESLSLLSRKMRLGGTLEDSFRSIDRLNKALPAGSEPGGFGIGWLENAVISHETREDEKASRMEAGVQRHSTISMFISTILPSFVMFAFVGSSVISGSGAGLLPFALAMLAVLPFSYALGYSELCRRYFA